MEFEKGKIRQIRGLLFLAAGLVLAIIYSSQVFRGIGFLAGILKPFLYGCVIAFVLNILLRFFENKVFRRFRGKLAAKIKRPLCMALAVLAVALVLILVAVTVLPQITLTISELGKKIPVFLQNATRELERLAKEYPQLEQEIRGLETLQINWETVLESVVSFLRNGAGDMLSSTFSVASGIISGAMNIVVAIIFALYILAQKERLANQGKRILTAFLPEKANDRILSVCALLYQNFASFITGQCLEAVILGLLFFVTMTIFKMPYALLIGVLIAFTALIPIVGAFIGCGVGAFLILLDNPVQALWFVVLFLVLQQIEGNLIYPRVVGNSVGLPSIWVLTAVSVGGSLFGVGGMLFFIPLTSSAYALFKESVNRRNQEKKGKNARIEKNS